MYDSFMRTYLKIIRTLSNLIDCFLLVVFLLVFVIGAYSLLDTVSVYASAQNKSVLKYRPEKGEVLQPELSGNIAWLSMEDSEIDYPVMQGENNEEYLNKDPYGQYSLSGSIFLDYRNKSDFSDRYSIVYGHHMEKKMMFGALDEWNNKEFFETHKEGTLTTEDGVYTLAVYAVLDTPATVAQLFQPQAYSFEEVLEAIRERAVFVNEDVIPTHLVALSTCKYPDTDDRTVVVCQIISAQNGSYSIDQHS